MQDVLARVGSHMRELREKHRMSQLELAHNLGKKSAAYVAMIESGERNMRATDLIRLARHLKVELSLFLPMSADFIPVLPSGPDAHPEVAPPTDTRKPVLLLRTPRRGSREGGLGQSKAPRGADAGCRFPPSSMTPHPLPSAFLDWPGSAGILRDDPSQLGCRHLGQNCVQHDPAEGMVGLLLLVLLLSALVGILLIYISIPLP